MLKTATNEHDCEVQYYKTSNSRYVTIEALDVSLNFKFRHMQRYDKINVFVRN